MRGLNALTSTRRHGRRGNLLDDYVFSAFAGDDFHKLFKLDLEVAFLMRDDEPTAELISVDIWCS